MPREATGNECCTFRGGIRRNELDHSFVAMSNNDLQPARVENLGAMITRLLNFFSGEFVAGKPHSNSDLVTEVAIVLYLESPI